MFHAPFAPLPLERHQRPSPGSVAKPLPAVAYRNLLRRQNDPDWLCGILGISMARTRESLAFSQVDQRDGALRSPQAEKLLGRLRALACGHSLTQDDSHIGSFTGSGQLRRSRPVCGNLEETHASENAEHFTRRSLGVGAAHLRYLAAADNNLEAFGSGSKKYGNILWGDIGNQVSEPVHLQHYA